MMTIRKRAPRPDSVEVHKRRGRYIVDVSYASPEGRKRHRQGFTRKVEADAHADSIRERLRAGKPPFEATSEQPRQIVTVLDVLLAYPKSERGEQHVEAIKKTVLASKSAEDFELADLEGFLAERGNLKTCAKDFSFLKRACALAKARGRISCHYFEKLAGDKVTRRRLMPAYRVGDSPGREIPDVDLERIFGKLNRRARRAVLFARTTGCRLGEVAALDWRAHWTPEGFRPITQKGSRPRIVACDPEVVGPRGIGLVFSELGSTADEIEGRLQSRWRYAVKAAKMPHYRFHDLRHTYGTLLRREGKTFSDIAAIMGITEAMAHVYAHEDTAALQREAITLGTNSAISKLARLA
jgi:integrase